MPAGEPGTRVCTITEDKAPQATFAEVMNKQQADRGAMRNIVITGDSIRAHELATTLKSDRLFENCAITRILQRGQLNMTVECNSPEEAQRLEEYIATKYEGEILVKPVVGATPQIKITRIFPPSEDKNELLDLIESQNSWFVPLRGKISRAELFPVSTLRETYYNLVLDVDLLTQKTLIERGSLIINFSQCRIFEHTNSLQCLHCLRFGHYARECQFEPSCKNCAGHHTTSTCLTPEQQICANCLRANEKGSALNTNHRSSDDRCPVKRERAIAIKNYMLGRIQH